MKSLLASAAKLTDWALEPLLNEYELPCMQMQLVRGVYTAQRTLTSF